MLDLKLHHWIISICIYPDSNSFRKTMRQLQCCCCSTWILTHDFSITSRPISWQIFMKLRDFFLNLARFFFVLLNFKFQGKINLTEKKSVFPFYEWSEQPSEASQWVLLCKQTFTSFFAVLFAVSCAVSRMLLKLEFTCLIGIFLFLHIV